MQSILEEAITSVTQETARVVGSGRTDAGAHSAGQVIAFDSATRLSPEVLTRAINAHLPRDVAVTRVESAGSDFHPRYDAVSRVYRYLIWNRDTRSPFWAGRSAHVRRPLDASAMDDAAQALVGRHDFAAFVDSTAAENRTRTMFRAACRRDGHLVAIDLEASGFMRQMARSIAGTLIRAGLRKLTAQDVSLILESRDRARAGTTAPACGLYLRDVRYPAVTGSDVTEEQA